SVATHVGDEEIALVTVTLNAGDLVSGFSISMDVPLEAFEVTTIEVPDELVDLGFDGEPRIDGSSRIVLSGGFDAAVVLEQMPVMTITLKTRDGSAADVHELSLTQALARDADLRTMDVSTGQPGVVVVDLARTADANG